MNLRTAFKLSQLLLSNGIPKERQFRVYLPERELFRVPDPEKQDIQRRGFSISAYSPTGAALKLNNAGLIEGIKNYRVIDETTGVEYSMYPALESPLVALDIPDSDWAC